MEKRYQSEGVVKGRDMVQTNMVCDIRITGVGVICVQTAACTTVQLKSERRLPRVSGERGGEEEVAY